jgi:hypothetical protein
VARRRAGAAVVRDTASRGDPSMNVAGRGAAGAVQTHGGFGPVKRPGHIGSDRCPGRDPGEQPGRYPRRILRVRSGRQRAGNQREQRQRRDDGTRTRHDAPQVGRPEPSQRGADLRTHGADLGKRGADLGKRGADLGERGLDLGERGTDARQCGTDPKERRTDPRRPLPSGRGRRRRLIAGPAGSWCRALERVVQRMAFLAPEVAGGLGRVRVGFADRVPLGIDDGSVGGGSERDQLVAGAEPVAGELHDIAGGMSFPPAYIALPPFPIRHADLPLQASLR